MAREGLRRVLRGDAGPQGGQAAADRAYIKALKVARVTSCQDAKASAALKLYGPRKLSVAGWLEQGRTHSLPNNTPLDAGRPPLPLHRNEAA